ncbi:MAG: tripartite tricarboxylate transporter permease [Planctomycetes bacterium]|nr:tripartite tricarboxylate transporter permease [Planctomycetota bacterium]
MLDNLVLLAHGFALAITLENLVAVLCGAFIGLVVGAMPGLGAITGISLLLPLTYGLNPTTAIITLASLYYATMYGGAFSAILLNIPGDTPAVMTALDGFKLTEKGQPGRAMSTSITASFIGGTVGILILTLGAPLLSAIGLRFGSPELALLILFALTSIGWLLGEDIPAGLLATGIGLMLATIGTDRAAGLTRFHFDYVHLYAGVSFIPLVVGLFGFAQVLEMITAKGDSPVAADLSIQNSLPSRTDLGAIVPMSLRDGILGTFVGVMPGAGATTASFIAYIAEKRINKRRDEMGTGSIIGVAAPESANNAAAAGAFAPLLTLGIPGSASTAVLLGGLMMWGLQPGPLLFRENPDFVWPLIASMYFGNLACLVVSFLCIPILVRAISISRRTMIPVITAVCVIAAYSINNAMFDVWFMLLCGVLGYFLRLAKIPTTPLLLTFVLAPMLEKYIRQSFDMTKGNPAIFFRNGICWTFVILIVVVCASPIVRRLLARRDRNA